MTLYNEIRDLAKKKNALILAHNYQLPEIQDVADYTGDSLELARIASRNDADIIVLCGVHFMAESAAILNPEKKVLIPEPDAGCPMADMITPEELREFKKKHPGAAVVTYINSSADVKAESDIICTSSNAVDIVKRIPEDTVLFIPDRNLGNYVSRFTSKKIIPWNGFCPIHESFTRAELFSVKNSYPDALVVVHPECPAEIIDAADEVLSTGGMVRFIKQTDAHRIILCTEHDMIHRLKKEAPSIDFISPSKCFHCTNMKKNTLEKLHVSLLNEIHRIVVAESTSARAGAALRRMLELS